MMINIDTWKEFTFNEIFVIEKGFYNKKPEHFEEGNIRFLGAVDKNNGVTEYYSLDEIKNTPKSSDSKKNAPLTEKIFPANALCVTNNGSVGFAYYQDEEFSCSHDVNPLYIKDGEFNKFTALFVATVIEKDRYRWAYGRKWRPERMMFSKILLPSTDDGNPDWEFMENYIKKLYAEMLSDINNRIDNLLLAME